jgi:urease accessory protein
MSIRQPGRALIGFALVGCFCLCPGPAHAHLVQTGFGTFYDGVAHVFFTPADLLLVVGFGLLAGSSGAVAARSVLFALPGAWLIGCLMGFLFGNLGSLRSLTTFSFGLVGLLVALNVRLRVPWLVSLAAVAGLLHGFSDGPTADWLTLAGATTAIFILVTLLAALVVSLRLYWAKITVRVAGSWIAAIGLLMLGWLVRGQG